MRRHARRQQTRQRPAAKPAWPRELVVQVVGVEVAADPAEERQIGVSEGAAVDKRFLQFDALERRLDLRLELVARA
jgi:hypothetical protein